ncbi:MAG: hypothetical protein TEF_04215 [Rhizobiales bacterium NRL2]|jgi:hypothetical protein|nr:MAG: hypothetical protein TEF_04215 [Rhizobiales bacterium NRL2]
MPRRTPSQQFGFANGMLDEALLARTDVKAYYAGARDLTNMLGLAQGGVETRGGFRHVAEIATPPGETAIRLARFAFSFETTYLIVFSHRKIEVFAGDALTATVEPDPGTPGDEDRFYTADELAALNWTQSLDTMILVHPDHAPKRLMRQGGGAAWVLEDLPLTETPTFDFGAGTKGKATPSATTGNIAILTTDSSDFDHVSFDPGDPAYWIRINDGLVKLTSRTDADTLRGDVIQKLDGAAQADAGDWTVEEDAWSDGRGWPRAAHLFQGRLYFAGTASRPQTIWGSRAGRFFSFETTADAFEDEAVEMTLDNDQVAAVEQLFAGNDFFAFTSGGIFANADTPVTPANFFLRRHSELPAAALRPVEIDGALAFIRRGEAGARPSCNELVFDDVRQIFVAQDLGLLAGGLIDDPVAIAARLGTSTDAANHLLVVNAGGDMAVLNTRRAQKIAGWTRIAAAGGGEIRDAATVGGELYCLIERQIGGTTRRLVERLDAACCLDSAVTATIDGNPPAVNWTGLDLFEGETVRLVGDGMDLGEVTVAGGAVETPLPVSTLEAGLVFDWAVETMPIEAELTDGTLVGNRHRLIRATVRAGRATRFAVNGREVKGGRLESESFDQPPKSFAGLKTVRFLGWSGGREGGGATVRVTGRSTEPASILSITAEVAQ